jgi:16S rRNA G1207 methylase RsmC
VSEHYFSGRPGRDGRRHDVAVHAWGHELSMQTVTGVFARAGLDPATDVLLRHTEPPAGGSTVLDLGCGWGPLACAIAVASPGTDVWAIDVNERALELTAANAERLGVDVHAVHPDEVPEDVAFDAIWSNPPIRVGKQALHALLLRWLARLADGGRAHLVVGKNLGSDSLQRWLTEQGWPTERMASERGFRVLRVERG